MTPLLLLTISVILTFVAIATLTYSLHCLRQANEHLAKAVELHLETHEQDKRLYDQFGLPPEDWNDWRPDR